MLETIENSALKRLFLATAESWPEHRRFLEKSFASQRASNMDRIGQLAEQIEMLIGPETDRFVRGYRWMCEIFTEEEIYFRRHGEYRCKSFKDAFDQVYGDADKMALYMDGLLLSQLLWSAHTEGFLYFSETFLPRLKDGYSLLEIGCGHGLLLNQAASDVRCDRAEGWDVSAESLRHAEETLRHFGTNQKVTLRQADLFAPGIDTTFDALVLSELLEHLENPKLALVALRRHLTSESLVYINIPVNSPAPDHISLWTALEDVSSFVIDCGYEIIDSSEAPISGYSLERAKAIGASINCLITARVA